jgi:hypothetical protein
MFHQVIYERNNLQEVLHQVREFVIYNPQYAVNDVIVNHIFKGKKEREVWQVILYYSSQAVEASPAPLI